MPHLTPPVLALAGGAGAGKTTLARALVAQVPGTRILHLDDCYHTDPRRGPTVPRFDGNGRVLDRSDPRSIDPDRATAALGEYATADPPLIIVEGMFALTLPYLRDHIRWRAYLDIPADVRLARKLLRKIDEGSNPGHFLRGYLERAREAHERHVAPARAEADLVLHVSQPTGQQVTLLLALIGVALTERSDGLD